MSSRSALRRAFVALLLAGAGVAVALGVAEIVARALGAGDGSRRTLAVDGDLPDPELDGLPELRSAIELAQPNVRGVHQGVLHRTNSAGMRGPEVSLAPEPGRYRIVIVGDSITMGHRVPEQDAYPSRVERLLSAEIPGADFEVLNLGLSGSNVVHNLRRLERVGLRHHPNLIVYGFTVNDIEGPHFEANSAEDRDAYLAELTRFADSPSRLLELVWPRWVAIRSGLDPRPGSYEYAVERGYLHNPQAWARVAKGLDRLVTLGRSEGVCVVVFIHAVMQQFNLAHPFERVYEHVAREARNRGLHVAHSLPAFRGRDAASVRFDVVDSHPNAEGHRLLAEALVEGVLALPPECRVPGGGAGS
jgi:lysophospholipase L1-like esterase